MLIFAAQLACVAFVAYMLWARRSDLSAAMNVGLETLSALFLLMFASHLLRTAEFTYMLRKLGVKEGFNEGFWLTGASFLLNHLPFHAGMVMRAVVLRRDHALSYASFASLTLVNVVINVAVSASVALFWLFDVPSVPAAVTVVLLGGILIVAALLFSIASLPVPRGQGLVARQVRNLAQAIVSIRGDGRAILVLAGIATGKILVNALRLAICFRALGHALGVPEAGLLAAVQTLSTVVNITPGNLGLREMLVSLVAAGFGTAYWVGLAAASIDRVVSLAYAVASGLPGLHVLRRRLGASEGGSK